MPPRRNLRLPLGRNVRCSTTIEHDDEEHNPYQPRSRIIRDMPIVYRNQTIHRRSLRVMYRERRALGFRPMTNLEIRNNDQFRDFEPMLRLEKTIRLVLKRLGFNRDVRDMIVSICMPHGSIGNPCVLF